MSIYQPESFYSTTLASAITAVQTTIPVTVAPNITAGYLVIEANTSNREIIKYTGVTGTTLTGVTRGLATYGSDDSAGTGLAHSAGVDIANKDVHFYYAQYYDFLTGVSSTGANDLRHGDGNTISAANRLWYVHTSSISAFWGLSANGVMVVSEDGVTSYSISAGGSGIAAGDGINITGGTASVYILSSGGIQLSGTKIKVGYDGSNLLATSAGELYLNTNIPVPVGTITMYGSSTPPTGWLSCGGAEYDGSGGNAYAALYGVIGTTYGGTSISAFNLPDLKQRIPVGYDSTKAYCSAMGYKDGVSAVTLSASEMPAHYHSMNFTGSSGAVNLPNKGVNGNAGSNTTCNTNSEGSGAAHNNLQPYITLQYIIKYL